jgi:hypothetical protein
VKHTAEKFHPPLVEIGLTFSVLMAEAKRDAEGNLTGPAIKHHGYPALAKVRIVSERDRAHGMADVALLLDGDRWPLLSQGERIALLDHELTHIELVIDDEGKPKADDLGRPKLRIRLHDFEAGWFHEVAERHGKQSQEVQQAHTQGERERCVGGVGVS